MMPAPATSTRRSLTALQGADAPGASPSGPRGPFLQLDLEQQFLTLKLFARLPFTAILLVARGCVEA